VDAPPQTRRARRTVPPSASIGPYIADFACTAVRLVVEVDGATHSSSEELAHDARRTKYLESLGWAVLRVLNTDVYENMDGVWLAIAAQLPPPTASRRPPPGAGEDEGSAQ